MPLPCGKRLVTLIWCILECLFFSGLLNGWMNLQQILKEDGYYLETCNSSLIAAYGGRGASGEGEGELERFDIDEGIDNPLTTVHEDGLTYKCVLRRVLKIMTIAEYEHYKRNMSIDPVPNHPNPPDDDVNMRQMTSRVSDNATSDDMYCDEQDEQLEFVMSLVVIIRNMLMFPLGIFLDKYGTSRTRIVAMACTVFGSLTMLFSSDVYHWLIFPALLLLGISGMLVLLTDLQISNLFGNRRLTVMSTIVGSYFSGGIVVFFMKLTRESGVTLQASFMFITIGIVPVLISTIAMLPRSRIPWPLPGNYGKNKSVDMAFTKHKAWNRRISVGGKRKGEMMEFLLIAKTKLYICMVMWFSLLNLKSMVFDLNVDIQLRNLGLNDTPKYMSLFAMCLLFSLPLAPFFGIVLDWHRGQVQQYHIQQMRNILHAICINYIFTIGSSVASLFPNMHLQVTSFILAAMEKVTLYAAMFAFLTHVHFPQEHFGKMVGIAISTSGVMMILQYPLKSLIYHGLSQNTFYVQILLLVMILMSCCHPLSVWYHCKTGQVQNLAALPEPERLLMESVRKEGDGDRTAAGSKGRETSVSTTTTLQITDL